MAHRTVLTERQRSSLFELPTDEPAMLRHYTLADDDLEIIRARRRPHNRFGFALQLCALRYPGRLLTPGEVIPMEITRFLAAQLGLKSDDLAGYASREETRHEHLDTSDNLLCRPRSPWRTAFCARYRGSLGLMGWFSVRAGVRRAHLG